MSREIRHSFMDIKLEPWGYEDELRDSIATMPQKDSPKHPKTISNTIQQKILTKKQHFISARTHRGLKNTPLCPDKSREKNFIERNQLSLSPQAFLTKSNYNTLTEDRRDFVPLGMKGPITTFHRQTALNTMYINYYDQNPCEVTSQQKSWELKSRKSSPIANRPRTGDIKSNKSNALSTHKNNSNQKWLKAQIYDDSHDPAHGMHSANNRLQKVLKIKEKLRLKLKKVSQQRDIQRGFNSKVVMKIQEQQKTPQRGFFARPKSRQNPRKLSNRQKIQRPGSAKSQSSSQNPPRKHSIQQNHCKDRNSPLFLVMDCKNPIL